MTNQTPHFPQLEFKFDHLNIFPQLSHHFVDPHFSHLEWRDSFFIYLWKIDFLEKDLKSPRIFILFYFWKEKQNKKENH